MATIEERDAETREYREKLKGAKSILCVGAGATGCESACYMKEAWPDKKIGICQRGDKLMPDIKGAHYIILAEMKRLDITFHKSGFTEGEGLALEYDMHLDCRGFRFNGPKKYM